MESFEPAQSLAVRDVRVVTLKWWNTQTRDSIFLARSKGNTGRADWIRHEGVAHSKQKTTYGQPETDKLLALTQVCFAETIAWRVVTTSGPDKTKHEL